MCTLLVACSTNNHNRPITSGVGYLRTAPSSAVKPLIQDMELSKLKITEASRSIKMVPLAILNTLVDSIFHFVDQPMLPSQKNFSPVEEIEERVKVDCGHGEIPEDFPEGVYI
ncbi:uncharacterized protein LOC143599638 [Bidens hawaiensis]|uniref:uncharacterized protein LOC143599638 n=1 Tax=Bidens hawaiensis TaxID=980011 RepID=UPI00404BA1FE